MRGARLVPLTLDCVAIKGHTEIVKALLAADDANVDAAEKYRRTPLMEASLSTRARSSLQRSAAPHTRRCSARTAWEAAH